MPSNDPVSTIQPPASIADLSRAITGFGTLMGDIEAIVDPARRVLDALSPLLALPDDVNRFVNDLLETIDAIELATAELIAIPIVGEVVAAIDETIDSIEEVIKPAEETIVTTIKEFTDPIARIVNDIRTPLDKIDSAVTTLKGNSTRWVATLDVIEEGLALAAGVGNALDALGAKAVGSVFGDLVDAYNAVVDEIHSPFDIIDAAMKDIHTALKPLHTAMDDIRSRGFDRVSTSVASIETTLNTVDPVHALLSHIQVVLKPFQWVLDEPGKIITKVLGPVLNPLMAPLEHKIEAMLGLPPDLLDQIQQATGAQKDSTQTASTSSTTVVTGQAKVTANQKTFLTTMESFVSTDVQTDCQNLLAVIQEQLKKPRTRLAPRRA